MRIDGLQYQRWGRAAFEEMRAGGLSAVHATLAYHGGFREAATLLSEWHRLAEEHSDLVALARDAAGIEAAGGRTAILLGAQNPSIIEDEIGLIRVWKDMGLSFFQITYNNQSLLGTGHAEAHDAGLTNMGREVVAALSRHRIACDLSHAGHRTTMEAIALSERPACVSHANPHGWHPVSRNVPEEVIAALAERGGVLGLSLYPLHMPEGVTLEGFCEMAAGVVERHGPDVLAIGSDLCRGRPDSAVDWMRRGRWSAKPPTGARFPPQPAWFESASDFPGIEAGLLTVMDEETAAKVMGGNWLRYLRAVL